MPFFRHVRRNARMLPMAAASDRRRATLGRSIGRGSARKNARSSQRGNGPPECQAFKLVDRADRPLSSCPTDQRWTEAGLLPPLPPAGIRTVFLGRSGPIQGVRRWLRLIRLFRLFRLSARNPARGLPGVGNRVQDRRLPQTHQVDARVRRQHRDLARRAGRA